MNHPATKRKRIAIWFDGPQELDELPFTFFLLGANGVQKSFFFCFPDKGDNDLSYEAASQRQKRGQKPSDGDYDVYIFIVQRPLPGNLFFEIGGNVGILTTATWERYFSPPSLFEYLFHSILCMTVYTLSDFEVSSHDDFTSGCQFEYTRIKSHDRVDIALGYICDEHQAMICQSLGEDALEDLRLLFSFRWFGKEDDGEGLAHRMKDYFYYDLKRDSGYKKTFLERVQSHIDSLWFDFAKEIFKGLIYILTAFLLIKFGLKK